MSTLPVFKPPFRGLLPLLLAYFVLSFILHPQSAIMQGRFIDPDDTMYALQSAELIDGQNWYDRTEHRMDAPDGTVFHFPRLMELPYAASIAALTPLMGRTSAIFVMAAFWPPVFLLGLMLLLRRQARLFMAKKWVGVTALFVMLSQGLLFDFMPGHIDHHGFIALLISLSFGFVLLMIARPAQTACAVAAGATMALALSIALEMLPWLVAITAYVGVWACLDPKRAKSAFAYAGTMLGAGFVLLLTYRAPRDLPTPDIASFSCVYLALLFAIALCFGTVWLLRHQTSVEQRIAKAGIFAAVAGAVFLCAFPQLLDGPYGGADQRIVDFLLPNIKEAIPLLTRIGLPVLALVFLPMPLLALGVCAWQMRVKHGRLRQMWLLTALMLVLSLVLSLFYEGRYASYAALFSIIPLSFLLWRMTRNAPPMRAVMLVTLAVLYPVCSMAFIYKMPTVSAVLYPMMSYTPGCDTGAAAEFLNRERTPRTIMNTMNEGPDILLQTPHKILSAAFHENIAGNLDSMNFFRAAGADEAEQIIRRRNVDYVLMCKNVDRGYVLADPLDVHTALAHPFVLSLLQNQLPPWLEPVPLNSAGDILLLRVKK